MRVSAVINGDTVTVTAAITDHTDIPLIGAFLPDIDVTAKASMILEPP